MAESDENETGTETRTGEISETVQFWLNEIGAARKREKSFRKEGQRIRDIYKGDTENTPFNILFSNTETMQPALYSAVPRPVVQRRFKDNDPIGKAAAIAGQRLLEFLLDTNVEGYETFNDGMKDATFDALLPGRGVTQIKYDAEISNDVKTSELVCVDSVCWDRVFFGYAKKWSKVPWVALELHIDKESATEMFGKETADKIEYTTGEEGDDDDGNSNSDNRDIGERKTALVYQIWDKDDRKVRYISAQYRDGYLKDADDPLGLTGFYPFPRPLMFVEKSHDLDPVPPYKLYEEQAKELNELTRRITRIAKAIKARGIYDGALGGDIANVIKGDDNELVPADKSSSLAAEKGLQNAIWFMPIQELILTHEKLLQAREHCKQTIYEITGISDIIRGATKASETLGAQRLKSQWGTLRIKPKQGEVQRYARDMLRIMLEIAASKFSEDTWAKMTGLPYQTAMQAQQTQMLMQVAQMSGQQVPPEMAQQAQNPTWQAVLAMLKDDMQRAYRIDIETNSTVEPEAVEDQKNIADLMTALGQFLNGVSPLVEKGVMPFEVAQTMMLSISRRFRFGSEIEDQLKAMKAPPPKQEGQTDAAKIQAETQLKQQQMQMDAQGAAAKMQADMALENQRMQQQRQLEEMRIAAQERASTAQMASQRSIEQMKAKISQDTELRIAAIERDTAIAVAQIGAKAAEEQREQAESDGDSE